MAEYTVGTATVTIGCATAAEGQIVAVGPVDEDTQHDAEWVFLDEPARLTPDLTLDLVHEAFGDGDDEAEWRASLGMRALMADHRLVGCALSFGSVHFDDDRRRAGPLPFTVVTDRWRPWEPVPDSRITGPVTLASRPAWHQFYYDHCDLLVVGAGRSDQAPPTPTVPGQGARMVGATPVAEAHPLGVGAGVLAYPGHLAAVVLDAGALFVAEFGADHRWSAWPTADPHIVSAFRYPPRGPVAAVARRHRAGRPGSDGHVHVNFDWQPVNAGPWYTIEVTRFAFRTDGDCVIAGDQLYVLATDGSLWTVEVDRTLVFSASGEWVRLNPSEIALRSFIVVADSTPVGLLATSVDGQVWDATIPMGQTPRWMPLGSPANVPVSPAVRAAASMTLAIRLDIVVTTDGVPYLKPGPSPAGGNGPQPAQTCPPSAAHCSCTA